MKQELAPRGVGIPGLQAGEDVKLFAKYVWEAALASRKTGDNEKPE